MLRPASVPAVTDETQAQADPELAVLSAIAHGQDGDSGTAARIARVAYDATASLDPDRSQLYVDLVLASLSEAAKRELQAMNPATYELQSDFAKQCVAKGKAEGKAEGRAELVARQLARRFGALPVEAAKRVATASIDELDAIGERLLTAPSLDEALRSP